MKFLLTLLMAFSSAQATEVKAPNATPLDFLNSFFSLQEVLTAKNMSLQRWFREDHIVYVLEVLNEEERTQMVQIFNEIKARIEKGETDMNWAVVGAGPIELIAKVGQVDTEVKRLKDQHKDVRWFAISKHEYENGQKYGDKPYSYHLHKVRHVLKRFGYAPRDSIFGLKLGTAAYLHDVIEDTDAQFDQISKLFGVEIADMVLSVTKVPRTEGMSDEDVLRATYKRTRRNTGARILKLADRIANVEEGLADLKSGMPSIVSKYVKEMPLFREMLFVESEARVMWKHLEGLIEQVDSLLKRVAPESCEGGLQQ